MLKKSVFSAIFYIIFVLFSILLNLEAANSHFSYNFNTVEIAISNKKTFPLAQEIENFALKLNKFLNCSLYFDTQFIINPAKVRDYHLKKKPTLSNIGKIITLTTQDGHEISCTYFDRGSPILTIVGAGFTNEREIMTPFVDMFDTDIVLFDLRGHGYKKFSIFDNTTWSFNLAKSTFGMDSSVVTLGEKEEEDIFTVVNHFKQNNGKNYRQINGVSICYSSFIFLKAEALWQEKYKDPLFSKITVDGCWNSLDNVVQKIKKDPYLLFSPQHGGWSENWFIQHNITQDALIFLARNIWGLQFNHTLTLNNYLEKITKTPVLFFYGKDDLMVNRSEFEEIWQSFTSPNKIAVITKNPHVRNHLKQKELYKMLCDLFFENSINEFETLLQDSKKLRHYYANKILQENEIFTT